MYIHRGLMLVILIIIIFAPAFQDWFVGNQTAWYRPFIAWAFVIYLIYRSYYKINKKPGKS